MDLMTRLFTGEQVMRRWLWVTLICNMGIVVTGGVVRVTSSGLGCPTWPRCTEDSFVPHPDYGWHGVIEFGNRLLTFVLIAAALATLVSVTRTRGTRHRLWWLVLLVLAGIPLQGVVGGITVWTQLNPWVVALHLLLSVVLIVLTVLALVEADPTPREAVGPSGRLLVIVTFAAAMLACWLGTVVTGAGPHAGDIDAPRNGLDIVAVARTHSLSAWALTLCTLACVWAFRRTERARRAALALLAVCLVQGGIGYWQYLTGVPEALVIAHLAGLTLVVAAAAWLLGVTSSDGGQVRSGSTAMARNSSAR